MNNFNKKFKGRDDSIKTIRENHKLIITSCQFTQCPSYTVCPKMGSHFRSFGKPKAKIFFIFETPSFDEASRRVPASSSTGMFFRETFLSPFIAATSGGYPYYISYVVCNHSKDEDGTKDRVISKAEYKTCWPHLRKALEFHRPEFIVALGNNAFSQLLSHASNRNQVFPKKFGQDDEKLPMVNLRGKFYDLALTDDPEYKPKVMPIYAPGYVLKSPATVRFFVEDRERLVNYLKNGSSLSVQSSNVEVKIENVQLLKTCKEVYEFFDFLQNDLPKNSIVAFDTETENLNRKFNNKFLTWQFCWKPGHAAVFPIDHPEMPIFSSVEAKAALTIRAQEFFDASSEKTNINWLVAHNAKFDLGVMYGLMKVIPRVKNCMPWWDTMLAMHWLDENRKAVSALLDGKPYSLKTLGKELLGFTFKTEHLAARADGELGALEFDDLTEYGASDTILTRALFHKELELADIQPDNALEKLERFMHYYYWPASRAVAIMECNGIWMNRQQADYLQGENSPVWTRMAEIDKDLQSRPEVIEFRTANKNILDKVGKAKTVQTFESMWDDYQEDYLPPLDLNKQAQQDAFYLDYLGLEPLKYSKKTNEASLDAKFLEHYAERYLEIPLVKEKYSEFYTKSEEAEKPKNPIELDLEYRKLKKLGTGYIDGLIKYLDDTKGDCLDSRIRANFHLHGCDTGRLCLAVGSRIDTVRDLKQQELGVEIENVKVGDLVYCYDENCDLRIKKVLWQGKTGHKNVVRIHWISGNNKNVGYLDVTPEHKIRLIGGNYKEAKDLQPKDRVLSLARNIRTSRKRRTKLYSWLYPRNKMIKDHIVTKIEYLPDPVDVYDLEIEDCPNFIANEICVHNSSSSPNFQNLPSGRTKMAKEIKNMFQAEPPSDKFPNGTALTQWDFSGAEVRVSLWYGGDKIIDKIITAEALLEEARESDTLTDEEFAEILLSVDSHKRTASLMYGVVPEKVTKPQRQAAKTITFALLFGTAVETLAAKEGWPLDEAIEKMDKFFSVFPRLKQWLDRQKYLAKKRGYVETLMGRRRRLSHYYATTDFRHEGEADRRAMNSPIQGQSSDCAIIGLINLTNYILENNLEDRWLTQNYVHDSVLIQVPLEDFAESLVVTKKCLTSDMIKYLETHWNLKIPVGMSCDNDGGILYGDLIKWDQRKKTLPMFVEKVDKAVADRLLQSKEMEVKKVKKPSPMLDLVAYIDPV